MTTSTSSLTREELEQAMNQMRVVTGALQIAVQTFISAFGPVVEQLNERFTEVAKTYPWLLEFPPDEQAEYDALEDDFEMRDPHPYQHGWNSQEDPAQGKCNVCGKPQDDALHEGLLAELIVEPKLANLPCKTCGCPPVEHPNPMCDAFVTEEAPPEATHEHYWSECRQFDKKLGRLYQVCKRKSCWPDPARRYEECSQ